MKKIINTILTSLCVGLLYLNPVYASNFICGQDLDGNGDITGTGENASCSIIAGEQFCSVGAQNCAIENKVIGYVCAKVTNQKYDSMSTCQSSCVIQKGGLNTDSGQLQWVTVDYDNPTIQDETIIHHHFGSSYGVEFDVLTYAQNAIIYSRESQFRSRRHSTDTKGYSTIKQYNLSVTKGGPGVCKAIRGDITEYTCPTAGNSCVEVGGIQKCSINKCIDLEVTPPQDLETTPTMDVDDGTRDVNGACMEQALMFSGRNLSCKSSGFTKNCCKSSAVVFNDSYGSILTNTAINTAITQTYKAVSAAYTAYTAAAAKTGATIASSSAAASSAAQSTFVGVDPYSIAIAIAIQVITKMISCGQQDTETAMLNGSGYCHLVGTYCSKKWSWVGCIQQSKSYCCFNSKLGRILQEQGREQMGLGWGTPKNPSCGGFTPNQFQSLDFSRIDMSEYYGDIKSKGDSLIQKNITKGVEDYYRQIKK